jgi:hypothetical protein
MKQGTKVIIRENGPWFGQEGIVEQSAQSELKGPGFDISVPAEHQQAVVKIMGGVLGIFVNESDLEVIG